MASQSPRVIVDVQKVDFAEWEWGKLELLPDTLAVDQRELQDAVSNLFENAMDKEAARISISAAQVVIDELVKTAELELLPGSKGAWIQLYALDGELVLKCDLLAAIDRFILYAGGAPIQDEAVNNAVDLAAALEAAAARLRDAVAST
jgi:hypothetical protein